MRYAVTGLEHFKLLASREFIALPAALDDLCSAALSYLALGRTAISAAGLLAAHLRHCAEQVIALLVVLCQVPENFVTFFIFTALHL